MIPEHVALLFWGIGIGIMLGYEAWALFKGGYRYTLTAGARWLFKRARWFMSIVAGFVAWLMVHLLIENKKDIEDEMDTSHKGGPKSGDTDSREADR